MRTTLSLDDDALEAARKLAAAWRWFDRNASSGWATCPVTQLGFVRVSSNPKITRDAVPPRGAAPMLERLVELPERHFWPVDITVEVTGPFTLLAFAGHRQATDAYLLALAQQHRGRLATFDRGIAELIAGREQRARRVELIDQRE